MFKGLKLKIASRRVKRKAVSKRARTSRNNRRPNFRARVWNAICVPFRAIARVAARIWAWIRGLDLIGLVNLTLLASIIVLFSMLIMDVTRYAKKDTIVVSDAPSIAVVPETNRGTATTNVRTPISRRTLPLKRDVRTRKFIGGTIDSQATRATASASAPTTQRMYGDIIVDRTPGAPKLSQNVEVRGNLYLQNMRKYTLPCGATIHGNLFLRNVNMLQFCGDFTVTGNIYVSPRSSFGPIPSTAHLGGQVIL